MENGDTFGIISHQIISQNAECNNKKVSGMHMQKNLKLRIENESLLPSNKTKEVSQCILRIQFQFPGHQMYAFVLSQYYQHIQNILICLY